jgi:hypothetical protein
MKGIKMPSLDMLFLQATVKVVAIGLIAFIVWCWITYLILKAAIRNGIRESGLPRWGQVEPTLPKERERPAAPEAPIGYRWELVREGEEQKPKRP